MSSRERLEIGSPIRTCRSHLRSRWSSNSIKYEYCRHCPGCSRGRLFLANRLGISTKPGQGWMPDMGKEIHLNLDSLEVGQILDGLRCRQESWANTAIYLRDGYFHDEAFIC